MHFSFNISPRTLIFVENWCSYKEAHETEVSSGLRAAQSDLLEYCAAYFECHPKAKSVIALAAAGLFWKWARICPQYVPEWNWIINEPIWTSYEVAHWHKRFSNIPFVLGTQSSDEELTQLNKHHILVMATLQIYRLAYNNDDLYWVPWYIMD